MTFYVKKETIYCFASAGQKVYMNVNFNSINWK